MQIPERTIMKEQPGKQSIRPLQPDDFAEWQRVSGHEQHGAWPGFVANLNHDFVTMTNGTNISPAIFENNQMIGASLNLLKADISGNLYLFAHMIGVDRRQQGRGVGKKLMDANKSLITEGGLPENVDQLKLTSDPLETVNVRLYLHSSGMTVASYIPDVYKDLAADGGTQHLGLPADRFLYQVYPKSEWALNRSLPSDHVYQQAALATPEAVLDFDTYKHGHSQDPKTAVVFVELPKDIVSVKGASMDEAKLWRQYQSDKFNALFSNGYTAVDHAKEPDGQQDRIVLMKDFNRNDPGCLIRALRDIAV